MNHFLHGTMDLSGPALTLSAAVFSTELIQSEAPHICSQGSSTGGKRAVGGVIFRLGWCTGSAALRLRPYRPDEDTFPSLFPLSSCADIHAVFPAVSWLVRPGSELGQFTLSGALRGDAALSAPVRHHQILSLRFLSAVEKKKSLIVCCSLNVMMDFKK